MKKLLILPLAGILSMGIFQATASADPATRSNATQIMGMVQKGSAQIQKDEAITVLTTQMAAITGYTTTMESQLQAVTIPSAASTDVKTFIKTCYKLGYDAASLQPVEDTADTSLKQTLTNQVTSDLSVLNAESVQVLSDLNPLTIAPPKVIKIRVVVHHTPHAKVTIHNWLPQLRNSAFIKNYVKPTINVGWKILIVLTVLSVAMMVRRLFRRTDGLAP